ncbi:MAG: efflux RND transporter periplasmic adaptor subunit [Planctomycetaceae bacterium]|nr:efflux RND transporter periplasmic adaptor subunit [Planctomycetaceae bacterium]
MNFSLLSALLVTAWTADPAVTELRLPTVVLTLIDQVDVPAREAGMLLAPAVTEGTTVEAGKLLGRIDDTESQLLRARAATDVQQARELAENDIKVRFAKKSAEVAQSELRRAVDSVEKFAKSVSQTELDRLKLIADKSTLEIEQAAHDLSQNRMSLALKQHDLDRADLQVQRRQITAPITGMVVQWKKHQGDWVEPGTPVVRIVRLNKLRAEGFAPATKLTLADAGRPVTLTVEVAGRPAEFPGVLVFVSPEIDPVNGQVRFWAEIENSKLQLRPGQSGALVIRAATPAVTSAPR